MSTSFLITLKNYLVHITGSMWNLYFPLLMLAVFIILAAFVIWIKGREELKINADDEAKHGSTTRKILSSIYLSGVFTLFIFLVTIIALLKFTSFFGLNICQFGVIVGFVLICVIIFIAYFRLCSKTRNREIAIVNVPISKDFMNKRVKHLKTMLSLKLWYFLIVGLPFFMIFISTSRTNLVSIVLDNSGSMDSYLPYGINSLKTVLAKTPSKSQYVFTTLNLTRQDVITDSTVNQYFNTIINTNNPSSLPTVTEIYSNSQGLINAFSQVGGDAGGSAILQGIWQNYLEARNLANTFSSKKLIVISDGMDNLYAYSKEPGQYWDNKDIFQQKGHLDLSPYEFFDGGIYCINLGGEFSENLWGDCVGSVTFFDGTNQQSYFDALVDILPEMFFDWVLIYILAGWLIITFLALAIVKSTVK